MARKDASTRKQANTRKWETRAERGEVKRRGGRATQLPSHLLRVFRQQQMVKACVRRRQARLIGAVTRDHKVEIAKTLDGYAVRTGAEEEKLLLRVGGQLVNDLPQQRNRTVRAREPVVVLRGALERLEVEHGRAADEELELLPSEELEALAAAHGVEAALEGGKLARDRVLEQVLCVESNVLIAVLAGDGDVGAAGHQVEGLGFAKILKAHLHAEAKCALDLGSVKIEKLLEAAGERREGHLEVG